MMNRIHASLALFNNHVAAFTARLAPLALLFALLLSTPAIAQTLSAGSAAGAAGSGVVVPVTLNPGGASISTLQFDLTFSSAFSYASISAGPAATAAAKTVSANPIPGGVRVLVFALNQNAIGAGVIANIRINIASGAPVGSSAVGIVRMSASSPLAVAVPLSATAGGITILGPSDTAAPVISGVSSSGITSNTATIIWTTNENADSQVQYGTSTAYGSMTALNSSLSTAHAQVLTGLAAGTTYHYRVRSKDAAGNLAVSGDYTFTTRRETADPVITGVQISDISDRSVRIRWTTDRQSDSEVELRSGDAPARRAVLCDLVTVHELTVNGLEASTQHRFVAKSADADGNQGVSSEYTFTTAAARPAALVLPRFSRSSGDARRSGDWVMTGIALTNMDSEAAPLSLTAMDPEGNLLSGSGIVNPRPLTLSPRSQFAVIDYQVFGDPLAESDSGGWVKLESTRRGVGGFFLTFDSNLTFMDGTHFGRAPLTEFVFTEIEPSGFTKINLTNPNSQESVVTIRLMNGDGTVRASESRVIEGNGALAADLFADLFPGVTPDPADYVRVSAAPGVQPFELMEKQAGDIAALAGQDLTAGAATLYSPQYVVGGPWKTRLSILNLDSRTGMVSLRLIGEDGVQIGAERAAAIPGGGKLYIGDLNYFLTLAPGQIAAGYVEIVSDGVRLAGNTVFADAAGHTFLSALPLVSRLRDATLFSHIASNDLYFTGLAIANPGAEDADVTIQVYNAGGALLDSRTERIPSGQRRSRLLTEYFPSLAGKDQSSGYIKLLSNIPIASFALIGTADLGVLSAIPAQDIGD